MDTTPLGDKLDHVDLVRDPWKLRRTQSRQAMRREVFGTLGRVPVLALLGTYHVQ